MYGDLVELYFKEKINIFQSIEIKQINILIKKIISTYENDGLVFTLGNGGGVSVSNGFAVDLRTHPFTQEDKSVTLTSRRLKVIDLTESSGMITGITNDIGPEFMFSEQLKNWLVKDENNGNHVLIAFSGSGNSQNVIQAINYAKSLNVYTTCISGRGGGKAAQIVDNAIIVPGSSKFPGQTGKNDNNFHIEDFQVSLGHIIVGILKSHVSHQLDSLNDKS